MQAPPALDDIFAALANPTRRAILDRLRRGEATVNELAAPFALSQPTISSHLRVLEAAGLVRRGRQANFRPVQLSPVALQAAHSWLGGYVQFWEDALDRLETHARTLEQEEKIDDAAGIKD